MSANVATSLKLDPELRHRIERLAHARERSPHWLMKKALEEYVTREERREKFNQDAMEAWEDYQRTGLHLTGEEVDEWLRRVAAGERPPMPEPHT